MPFDVEGAKKAGYTDSEIADHLAKQSNFDIAGARKAGYSDPEIVSHLSAQAVRPVEAVTQARTKAIEEPAWWEKQVAKLPDIMSPKTESMVRGFTMGMAEPSVGAAQLVANVAGQGQRVNPAIAAKEAEYLAAKQGAGREGFDWMKAAGNVLSPVNLLLAARLGGPAAGAGGRAIQGGKIGAAGGALQPVVTDEDKPFIEQKLAQVAAGTIGGAVLGPLVGKIGDIIARRVAKPMNPTEAATQTDQAISQALSEVKQSINDIDPVMLQSLRNQVSQALQTGKKLDAAAALRKADFEALGMPSLQGQITRDPAQFAREMNLRGVSGVGDPILQRMSEQNRLLQSRLGGMAEGAQGAYPAGAQISGALASADKAMRQQVSNLYTQAKQSAGKDLDVPLTGLAQDFADVLDRFADKVPGGVRQQFAKLGLDPANPSNQLKTFTIEDSDKLLKVINAHVGADKATNTALGELRDAVKAAVTSADVTGGPFAPAVAAAAKRFKMHEAVPSLEAAANGTVAPDDFVRRFIINGKTEEVQGLAKVLSKADPNAYQQARAQLGAELQKAAFGENLTLDKQFAAERFQKKLRELGSDKISAFFSPKEITDMKTMARVGAYIGSVPERAPVNYSNTAAAMTNLLRRVPGIPAAVSVADALRNTVNQNRAAQNALASQIPWARANLPPEVINRLSQLSAGGAFIGGGLAGGVAGQ